MSSIESSSEDEDFGFNFADLKIYNLHSIVDHKGEGDDRLYLAYWRPIKKWPKPTWHHHSNFSKTLKEIKDYHKSKGI